MPLNSSSNSPQIQKPTPDLRELARVGWRILADSYFTDVCLQFPPQTIAAASLFLAAKITRSDFGGMQWWTTLDPEIRIEEIQG